MKANEGNDAGLIETVAERVEEGEKEKRKKRRASRRNRQNRQNQGGLVYSGKNSDGNEVIDVATLEEPHCGEVSSAAARAMDSSLLCKPVVEEIQLSSIRDDFSSSLESSDAFVNAIKLPREGPKASDVAFISLPSMHITDKRQVEIDCGSMPHQNNSAYGVCGNYSGKGYSKSCPSPISFEKFNPASPDNGFLPYQKTEAGRKCFVPYWSTEDVNKALERGDAFRATFRVNAHFRLEAYCTIDGVPIDVLISGSAAQNRAIEGDVVAIVIDPVACWPKLKGSPSGLANSSTGDDSITVCESTESADEVLQEKHDPIKAAKFRTDQTSSFLKDISSNALENSVTGEVGFQVTSVTNAMQSEILYMDSTLGHLPHNSSAISKAANGMNPQDGAAAAVQKLAAIVRKFQFRRPTGRVVAIVNQSPRRNAVIGFLGVRQWMSFREGIKKDVVGASSRKNNGKLCNLPREYVQLTPMDGKLPKMMVLVKTLPCCIKERLRKADITVEMELVAAKIHDWKDESFLPQAFVLYNLGQGTDIESQMGAILFEHAILHVDFPPESLACLPKLPWIIPSEEFEKRKDFRNLCVFTIDPSTATDLDDALSVEKLSDDIIRVGVHIADVSHFVMPGTSLDKEAQLRSTSVYLLQHKVPMLPPVLSEDLGSLNPGADKLAFSITWDINRVGDILDQWIGRTVIRSCCKLSYEQAQDIIDERLDIIGLSNCNSGLPELHGTFDWETVIDSVRMLNRISMTLKERRFKDGALWLDSPKLVLLFDECGLPFDTNLHERISSNFLVEELMLLANMTTAKVISNAYPDCALLRRHPEPNTRKLKEFEAFCRKHGFELDTSSSGRLHMSLQKIQKKLENDPVLFDILVNYASKPMQLAAYFCTGQLRDRGHEWAHYSLSVPFYTHFTSPLRRYPDIIVHRTLTAVLEAEQVYAAALQKKIIRSDQKCSQTLSRYFSGLHFDKKASDSKDGKRALIAAASRQNIPGTTELAGIAAYCNDRRLASRQAQDASEKVYLWALLKRKEALISDARVLGLGPKFMSVYVNNFAMERRIYYDDIEGLVVDWLETTSTLILDLRKPKISHGKGNPGKPRVLEDIALIVNPSELKYEDVLVEMIDEVSLNEVGRNGLTEEAKTKYENLRSKPCDTEPAVLPLTLQVLSQVPVSIHAVGGDNGPADIAVKLYLSSYHKQA